jgi:hypothetical protein
MSTWAKRLFKNTTNVHYTKRFMNFPEADQVGTSEFVAHARIDTENVGFVFDRRVGIQ